MEMSTNCALSLGLIARVPVHVGAERSAEGDGMGYLRDCHKERRQMYHLVRAELSSVFFR